MCTGLAEVRKLNVVWIRLAFVLLALLGGLGILIYVSCWLIPEEDGEAGTASASGIVALARATAASAGLVTLAALGVVATIF